MSLLNIPVPPARQRLKVEIAQDVLADFDRFVEFARDLQPHATADNILEYLVRDFFSSGGLSDVKEFRTWCDEQDRITEPRATQNVAQSQQVGLNSSSKDDESLDETGEFLLPDPLQRHSEAGQNQFKA